MFQKNKNRKQYQGSASSQFKRGNATPSRTQQLERLERQQATERQLSVARKLRHHRRRIQTTVFIVAGVLLFLGWRSMISGARVSSDVKISAEQSEAYQNYIASRVGEYSVLKQGWSLDTVALEQDVKQKFPEVKEVDFSESPLASTIKTKLGFRKPLFLWKDSSGATRFLDQDGVLFGSDLTGADVKKLTVIEDESGAVINSGSVALSSATTELIGDAPHQLKALYSKGIKSVVVPKSTREIRIKLNDVPYFVKFSTERNLSEQVGELRALRQFLKKKNKQPRAYVDVRLEHKAYYK